MIELKYYLLFGVSTTFSNCNLYNFVPDNAARRWPWPSDINSGKRSIVDTWNL